MTETGGGFLALDTVLGRAELTAYGRVRIRMRRTRVGFADFDLFRQKVRLGEWTEYERAALDRIDSKWPQEVIRLATKDWYEIEGTTAAAGDVQWTPLSAWRREELRRAQEFAMASVAIQQEHAAATEQEVTPEDIVAGDAASMNEALAAAGAKPVNSEVAVHLLKHLKRPPKHAVQVVNALVGLGWTTLRLREPDKFGHMQQHFKNGAKLKNCRFCAS